SVGMLPPYTTRIPQGCGAWSDTRPHPGGLRWTGFGKARLCGGGRGAGRRRPGMPWTILASALALTPLVYFASAEQKEKWLTAYCEGQEAEDGPYLATYGFTDIDGAANFDSLDPSAGFRTHARLEGDHYVINGAKYFATNGTGWERKGAWLYTLFCRT